ncbi:DUF2589 domain-containing protein [Stenotrophomonas pavanii]|uniref:DUF2589 domain-containing protein n=1 Tax=Stenotrophomonas TaxID=40323 RepID=UPI0013105000|nr:MULTISPECIES: DUF2589 domain-containing protein [Stenotrophomonas]MDA3305078.1 DUF2589 domain-containing protein [Stenotrophomonas sp. PI_27]MDQ7275442.1 DUF2589 domain-containing protein [Stenotrophomonas sp. Sm3147]MDQ7284604.1 DUF2589 domain-containing protein [Stenotrophomonas sp. Sm5341]MEC4339313.1 DUF2589 domain-containing protein [Stenotrophomonas pavanii]WGS57167.1 DUF2589 domain-containing protein [Stenotrophomonas pavanii]
MSGTMTFHSLIEALAGAVIEAQDSIEMHQLSNLRDFFDEDNRPRSVTIRLPSQHPQAEEGDEDLYRAPLLPLVSTNNLRIREVEISFDADLADLGAEDPDVPAPGAADAWESPRPAARHVGLDTGRGKGVGNVHVQLRVEGTEPTDGAARLMNHLAQSQGVFKTIKAT